jgi:hypothetical protein
MLLLSLTDCGLTLRHELVTFGQVFPSDLVVDRLVFEVFSGLRPDQRGTPAALDDRRPSALTGRPQGLS